MNDLIIKSPKTPVKGIAAGSLLGGLGMWVTGGLYHNLILPVVDEHAEPHHEGLFLTLMAYFLLAFLMSLMYANYRKSPGLVKGLMTGMLAGVLWVLPHGIAMAATHGTPLFYEFTNALYHLFEQGLGGIIIFYSFKKAQKMKS